MSLLVVLVVDGLKTAVTPTGTPTALSVTTLVELLRPETLTVTPAVPLAGSVRLLAEDEMLKVDLEIVSVMGVVSVVPAEVPCTVAVYVPGIAALLAVNVTVFWLLVTDEANVAVTPAGKPVALSTTPGEDAPRPATVILLAAPSPTVAPLVLAALPALPALAESVRSLGDAESVKLPGGIVTTIVALPVSFPDVPVTTTM